MNRNKTRRLLAVFVIPLMLLVVGCGRGDGALVSVDMPEASQEAFMIQFRSVPVSVDDTASEGTFEAAGLIDDAGAYTEIRSSSEPLGSLASVAGWKTVKGTKGTMLIKYYVGLSPTGPNTVVAQGGFSIVEGSGAYQHLVGGGKIDIALERNASVAMLTEILEGEARYKQ